MDNKDVSEPHFPSCQSKLLHHPEQLQILPQTSLGDQLRLEECKIRVVKAVSKHIKPVSLWTEEEVCEWIRNQYPRHYPLFVEAVSKHAISGRVLLRLTAGKLKRIGIHEESQCEALLQEILQLRIQDDVGSLTAIFAALSRLGTEATLWEPYSCCPRVGNTV
ncbi:sterile alpha motif domain-containing protein 12-like isoform X2 [Callorhinchus milii]|uniref:Sterile alpha motif domain-containing protein 12-like n=1 Tax=Callorhinchus milii TaxID=7868 RepID=A0A4W3HE35_CALMI|nr:sterile alpha motif domain-containing protein 12-like isoform X2 [Callorhinchus milii]|eukprot:gi/632964969/ref/XP_007898658.1/ PREDICTED: sterile alpha motif domain-containing protein 12-like isoform X2 [Callorhinchus milii]